jgi:hypothetical protein
MQIRISEENVRCVGSIPDSPHGTLLLGAITESGDVHLVTADGATIRDHRSWIARDAIGPVSGGFALLVRGGRIVRVFRSSEFNRSNDALLPMELVRQIVGGLPAAPDAIIYGT